MYVSKKEKHILIIFASHIRLYISMHNSNRKKRNRNSEHISCFRNRENNKKKTFCQSTETHFRKEIKLIFDELYQEEIMYLKKSKLYTTSLFESAFLKKQVSCKFFVDLMLMIILNQANIYLKN
jgi:sensor c-di-GMP phosphodiesterase-like protein